MRVYDGDKLIKLNNLNYDCNLDGTTSIVFTDFKKVYKIKRNYNDLIEEIDPQEEFFRYLVDCNLNLNVISIPKGLLYDKNDNFVGTYSNYVDGKNYIRDYYKDLLVLNKNEFLMNFQLLEDDLYTLSKYNIRACDISPHNSIYRDTYLYHIDYGDFYKDSDSFYDYQTLDLYIYNLMLDICRYSRIKLNKEFKFKNSLTFIKENMSENDKVKDFVKKLSIF